MSIDEVKSIEKELTLSEEEAGDDYHHGYLAYQGVRMYNTDVELIYCFWTKDIKLGRVLYMFKKQIYTYEAKDLMCTLVDRYYKYNSNMYFLNGKADFKIDETDEDFISKMKHEINTLDFTNTDDNIFLLYLSGGTISVQYTIDDNDSNRVKVNVYYESDEYTEYKGSDNL